MELDEAIRTRRTHKAYRQEPVERATLDELFELARWAPNHNLTNPWRFRVLGPKSRERLKAAAEAIEPGSGAKLDRAPTLVAASVAPGGDPGHEREDLPAGRARPRPAREPFRRARSAPPTGGVRGRFERRRARRARARRDRPIGSWRRRVGRRGACTPRGRGSRTSPRGRRTHRRGRP